MASSQELEALLRDSLLNNSYDWDEMHAQLKRTHLRSYSYLLDLQRAYIGYEELMYHTSDTTGHDQTIIGQMYLDATFHARFDIEKDIIGAVAREEYRRSSFYQKPLTIVEMINNPTIFTRIPIVMIDNRVIWDWTMYIKTDTTTFALPFSRSFVIENGRNPGTDQVVYVDHDVTVLVVENEFYQRSLVTKNAISYDPLSGSVRIPKSLLAFVPNRKGVMFMSFHLPNSAGKAYELGTTLIPLTEYENFYQTTVDDGVRQQLNAYTLGSFYISLIYAVHLKKHVLYTGGDTLVAKYYEEDGLNAPLCVFTDEHDELYYDPIPVENVMVFKKNDRGNFVLEKNTRMVKLYYPNIYQIIDPNMVAGDEYKIWYFYYADATDTRYRNLFDFYYQYLRNVFDAGTRIEEIVNTVYYALDTDKSQFFEELGYHEDMGLTVEEVASVVATIATYLAGSTLTKEEIASITSALEAYILHESSPKRFVSLTFRPEEIENILVELLG